MNLFSFFVDPIFRASIIGSMLICLSASLLGVLLFVKHRSLLGEALSHASFPGIVCGGFVSSVFLEKWSNLSLFFFLGGGFLFSFLGYLVIEKLVRKLKIHPDAALCFVLSTFLGAGVLISSRLQWTHPLWYKQVQFFLYGQVSTLLDKDLWLYFGVAFLVVFFILLKFREIELRYFDAIFAQSIGAEKKSFAFMTSFLLVLVLVIGIRSVGIILMAGMFIAPAICARQFTHRLSLLFSLAGLFGVMSGYGGNVLSVVFPLWLREKQFISFPAGPMIVLFSIILAFLSLLFAPKRGVVARFLRVFYFRLQCQIDHLLKFFWKGGEKDVFEKNEIVRWNCNSKLSLTLLLFYMKSKGWVQKVEKTRYLVTKEGKKRGAYLVRLHRLWEVYLASYLKMGEEKIHQSAEEMEHILTPELEAQLTTLLSNPLRDLHHQMIPKKEL